MEFPSSPNQSNSLPEDTSSGYAPQMWTKRRNSNGNTEDEFVKEFCKEQQISPAHNHSGLKGIQKCPSSSSTSSISSWVDKKPPLSVKSNAQKQKQKVTPSETQEEPPEEPKRGMVKKKSFANLQTMEEIEKLQKNSISINETKEFNFSESPNSFFDSHEQKAPFPTFLPTNQFNNPSSHFRYFNSGTDFKYESELQFEDSVYSDSEKEANNPIFSQSDSIQKSLIKLQSWARQIKLRREFLNKRAKCIKIQQFWRARKLENEKILKEHLFILNGQQKKVVKELQKLIQIESALKLKYETKKRFRKFSKQYQQKLSDVFTDYIEKTSLSINGNETMKINSAIPNVFSIDNTPKENYSPERKQQFTPSLTTPLHSSIEKDLQALHSVYNVPNAIIDGIAAEIAKLQKKTQESRSTLPFGTPEYSKPQFEISTPIDLNFTTRATVASETTIGDRECRCDASRIVLRLRDQLKMKLEENRIKEQANQVEVMRIQDEWHLAKKQHTAILLLISEALKKVEIQIITDLSAAETNEVSFTLLNAIQQIGTFIADSMLGSVQVSTNPQQVVMPYHFDEKGLNPGMTTQQQNEFKSIHSSLFAIKFRRTSPSTLTSSPSSPTSSSSSTTAITGKVINQTGR